MPILISEFKEPTVHPFGMLDGYKNAFEKESVLFFIFNQNFRGGVFEPVKTKHDHPAMVEDGLLKKTGDQYELTQKAIGLLYSVYHK